MYFRGNDTVFRVAFGTLRGLGEGYVEDTNVSAPALLVDNQGNISNKKCRGG
jgi:hypothetical protein